MCVLPHFYRISLLGEMDVLVKFSEEYVKGAKSEMPNVEDNLPDDLRRWLRTRGLSALVSESKAFLVRR